MPLTKVGKEFVDRYWKEKTDEEMSVELGVKKWVITNYRNNKGLSKAVKPKEKVFDAPNDVKKDVSEIVLDNDDMVPKEKRTKTYILEFKNTHQYDILKEIFNEAELNYYITEFCLYMAEIRDQDSRYTKPELRTLDGLIRTQIRINRTSKRETELNNKIAKIETIIENKNFTKDEGLDVLESRMIGYKAEASKTTKEYVDLHTTLGKQNDAMETTRKSRMGNNADAEISITQIVKELQDARTRRETAKHAALLDLARKKKKKEFIENGAIIGDDEEE